MQVSMKSGATARQTRTEAEMHERVTGYYRSVQQRFALVVALREQGFDAHVQEKVIVVYDMPDGEGPRRFTTNDEAQMFLYSRQAIEDGGCE